MTAKLVGIVRQRLDHSHYIYFLGGGMVSVDSVS